MTPQQQDGTSLTVFEDVALDYIGETEFPRGSFMPDLQSDLFAQESQQNVMTELLGENFNS